MFLSKDFLDEPAAAGEAPPWGSGRTPSAPSAAPGPSGSPLARQGSMGRPAPSPLSSTGGVDGFGAAREDDTEATPTSAAGLRQKMLLQRQRTLQKQRTTGSMANSSMVMANAGLPVTDAIVTPASKPAPGPGRLATAASGHEPEASPSSGYHMIDQAMRRASMDNEDGSGVVMPDPSCQETEASKEEEARRRSTLAQSLDERGICHVFDPTRLVGSTGSHESTFDISSMASVDVKSFILNPSPKHAGMIECRIIRERSGLSKLFPKYTLENDAGVFLMSAKKQKNSKTSNYSITMARSDSGGKNTDSFLGKLRSNFLGLEFTAYGTGLNPKKIDSGISEVHAMQLAREELVAVQYSSSLWGSKPRGPRKMSVVIPHVQPSGERLVCRTLNPDSEGLLVMQKSGNATHLIDVFENKPPKWNERIGAFVLNFNKRVTQASVKNFQLTNADDPDTVYLQFGRVGKDVFNIDFRFPFSPFQAFAICLSSFDYKLCCE